MGSGLEGMSWVSGSERRIIGVEKTSETESLTQAEEACATETGGCCMITGSSVEPAPSCLLKFASYSAADGGAYGPIFTIMQMPGGAHQYWGGHSAVC